jgi:23S rRNA maturation mini-RNase III|tara:strand:+ start:2842 stop:3138 length:297 start_codon:yes stop_codon:yes gene_type:complete
MEITNPDYTIVQLIAEFGFAIIAVIGLAYFIYYIWNFISERIDPKIEEMHMQLIRVIDQVRMLDQDLIRLQEKVNVVLEYKENEKKKRGHNGNNKGKS